MTRNNDTYQLCGQHLHSELPLPELPSSSVPGEIGIHFGDVPEKLAEASVQGACWQAAPGRFLLNLPKIGRFLAEHGTRITLRPTEGTKEQDLRVFLLSSTMGALFHQRQLFPLHGSAVLTPKGALVIVGSSGSGKSTLAATLVQLGFQLLCDELCVCTPTETGFQVWPEAPCLRLCHDTLQHLELPDRQLPRLRPNLEKFLFTPDSPPATDPYPLWQILVLTTDNQKEIRTETLLGIRKFNMLKQNCFRSEYLPGMDLNGSLFRHYSQLAASAALTRITRPHGTKGIRTLVDLVLQELDL